MSEFLKAKGLVGNAINQSPSESIRGEPSVSQPGRPSVLSTGVDLPPVFSVIAGRLYPNFDVPLSRRRKANIADWKEIGFSKLEQDGLGVIVSEGKEYTIVGQIKTVVSTPSDILLVALPNPGYPITQSLDDLPQETLSELFQGINQAIRAEENVAKRTESTIKRLYVLQHIGVDELNNFPFATSIPQTHIHISPVTERDIMQAKIDESQLGEFCRRTNRFVYADPLIPVARDLLEESGRRLEYDAFTSSFILSKTPYMHSIPPEDQEIVVDTMQQWKRLWHDTAACFTDFNKDEDDRIIPIDRRMRVARVNKFIQNHPGLSEESRGILLDLATRLKNFDQAHIDKAFFNNISGSIGWTVDYDTNLITLRFAPRTRVHVEKVGATDGFFKAEKDLSIHMSETERERILDLQRQIFSELSM